tara:strand:+ start:26 stop:466 length:441 start_codon:yes stop_codon:yes gene_type:complete
MKIKKNGKIVNLTESDLHRIVKRVLNEQKIIPTGKLNLFCKSNKTDNSFKENNLYYSQNQDLPNGVKKLFLDRKTPVRDNVFGEDDQSFTLNVTPVSLLGNEYSDELDIDAPNDNIVLMNYKSNVTHFCALDSGTDQEWSIYFNTF